MSSEKKPLFQYSSGVLARSQSKQPDLLLDVLVATAVKESWIMLLINLHVAIFFGLILLASGYGILGAFTFLMIHLGVTCVASLILVFLIRLPEPRLIELRSSVLIWLVLADTLLALGWGISIMQFFGNTQFAEIDTLVVLLLAAGISSAALSAKLLRVLVVGRLLVFMPSIAYLLLNQPPDWLLHTTSLVLSFMVALGIGYAIHIQLLREASLVVEVNQARAQTIKEAAFREHFLRSITHDLRQPLSAMTLFARSLQRRSPDNAEVESINHCLASAHQILEDVAQLAWLRDKLPTPRQQCVILDKVLAPLVDSYHPIAAQQGIHLRYQRSAISLLSDGAYLERAVRNLLDNAMQYTKQGGVLLGVRRRHSINAIDIQVLDTGCGIDPVHWDSVFQDYQRLEAGIDNDEGHLGLGLSIVSRIADALQGEVIVNSEINKGTCFSLRLPYSDIENKKPLDNTPNGASGSTGVGKRVLIIDDDEYYAQHLANTVSEFGLTPRFIVDAQDIDALFVSALPEADFYIIDYQLGNDMSGVELLKKLPQGKKGVLVSSYDIQKIADVDWANSAFSFVRKHSSASQMRTLIAQLTGAMLPEDVR